MRRCLRKRERGPGEKRIYRHWLYLVEPEIIAIPEWAQALQPKDFERDPRKVWVPRFAAKILREMDEEDGGHCSVIKSEYKRCIFCDALLIQVLAERVRRARYIGPCGPGCLDRAERLGRC